MIKRWLRFSRCWIRKNYLSWIWVHTVL